MVSKWPSRRMAELCDGMLLLLSENVQDKMAHDKMWCKVWRNVTPVRIKSQLQTTLLKKEPQLNQFGKKKRCFQEYTRVMSYHSGTSHGHTTKQSCCPWIRWYRVVIAGKRRGGTCGRTGKSGTWFQTTTSANGTWCARMTSKTPEGRRATFRVQGLGVVLCFLFFFGERGGVACLFFLTSIAARFIVQFFRRKSVFLSRLGRYLLGGLFFDFSHCFFIFWSVFCIFWTKFSFKEMFFFFTNMFLFL